MGIRQQDVDPETWRRLCAAADAQPISSPALDRPAVSPPKARRGRPKAELVVPAADLGPGSTLTLTIPLRLDPTTNGGAVKRWLVGVAGKHRRATGRMLALNLQSVWRLRQHTERGGRVSCTITRLGGGRMDDDNLPPTAKWVRDTVALFLGVDDGPQGPIEWAYDQQPGGPWGVRVRLEAC